MSCIAESNLRDFLELYKMINVYGNKRSSREYGVPFQVKQMCLAFFNGQWHRACVLQTNGDAKPECLLLDILQVQKVKITQIIPMPKIFVYPPPMVEICKLDGVDENPDESVKSILSDLIQVYKLIEVDEVVELGDEMVLRLKPLLKE